MKISSETSNTSNDEYPKSKDW